MMIESKIESKLVEKRIRPTVMRLLVMEKLSSQTAALSLTELEDQFNKSDRTTLYRTLKTFQEKGLVHGIDDGTGALKYALCEDDCKCDIKMDMHVHFHCKNCGETICLPNYKVPDISLPKNYAPEEVNFVFKGVCASCSV